MCGRYTLHQKAQNIAKRYNLKSVPGDIQENFNVSPGQIMPVITNTGNRNELEFMKWGLIPSWSKDPNTGYKLINARGESIFEKPIWRKVILQKRALIPADGFYEWKKLTDSKERKQPFYIHPKQQELFSFAGVWEVWKDASGKEWKTYSIVTTEPNKEMASIHNRMPVILYPEDEASWLEPSHDSRNDIEPFIHPYEDNGLEMYEVSSDVNTPRNNSSELLKALDNQ